MTHHTNQIVPLCRVLVDLGQNLRLLYATERLQDLAASITEKGLEYPLAVYELAELPPKFADTQLLEPEHAWLREGDSTDGPPAVGWDMPCHVPPSEGPYYYVVGGHRRTLACLRAEIDSVAVTLRGKVATLEEIDRQDWLATATRDNSVAPPSPHEKYRVVTELIGAKWSYARISDETLLSRSQIAIYGSIRKKLPKEMREATVGRPILPWGVSLNRLYTISMSADPIAAFCIEFPQLGAEIYPGHGDDDDDLPLSDDDPTSQDDDDDLSDDDDPTSRDDDDDLSDDDNDPPTFLEALAALDSLVGATWKGTVAGQVAAQVVQVVCDAAARPRSRSSDAAIELARLLSAYAVKESRLLIENELASLGERK